MHTNQILVHTLSHLMSTVDLDIFTVILFSLYSRLVNNREIKLTLIIQRQLQYYSISAAKPLLNFFVTSSTNAHSRFSHPWGTIYTLWLSGRQVLPSTRLPLC